MINFGELSGKYYVIHKNIIVLNADHQPAVLNRKVKTGIHYDPLYIIPVCIYCITYILTSGNIVVD